MLLVMGVCERIYVLDHGQLIADGLPKKSEIIQSHRSVSWGGGFVMLKIEDINVYYGNIHALKGFPLKLMKGKL